MKHGIFISYSDFDKDKVSLIVSELQANKNFYSIVIASNREALKPLAQKVADGILNASIVIPLLTHSSIPTQWINQEIGYATALKKKVMPIVESECIDKLKGFIHKQIDLPYNYESNSDKAIEDENFIVQVKKLISDLEVDFDSIVIDTEVPEKSEFEKSLEQIDIVNEELEFQRKRSEFLNSTNGSEELRKEILSMFKEIEDKVKTLQQKKINIATERNDYQLYYILKSHGFSFSIFWQQAYSNSIQKATLEVRKWNGSVTKEPDVHYFPGEEPKVLSTAKYIFDYNRQNEICWLNQNDQKNYFSSQIIDECIKWLLEQVFKRRLENK